MRSKYHRTMRKAELGPYPRVDLLIRQWREVAKRHSLVIPIVVLALFGLVRIGTAVANSSVTVFAAQASPGSYVISCLMDEPSGAQPCPPGNEIQAGTVELVLKAHVLNSSGQPARRGSVTFQDCELKNHPAPFEACESGSGSWSFISTMPVDTSGNAEVDYGLVSTPTTIGFRFRYIGQGSGISNGESAPMDVTWF